MECRELGRTGWKVSEIGLGTWAMGGSWGAPTMDEIRAIYDRDIRAQVHHLW